MKTYVIDIVGDENPIDIDVAILNCILQDAVFELLRQQVGKPVTEEVHQDIIRYISYTHDLED